MKKILLFILVLGLCVAPCFGAWEDDISGLDELWEQSRAYGVTPEQGLDEGMGNLFSSTLARVGGQLRSSAVTGLKLLAVVLLCALAEGASLNERRDSLRAVELTGTLAITALTMTDMATMIGLGRDTIGRMDSFSQLLLPVVALLTAATGGVSGAAVRQGSTMLFSQLLIGAMDRLLIPMVYSYVALSCAHAAVGNPGLKKLADLIKSGATALLTAILLAFVAYLTASGAVAGTVDAAAVKAAKLAIGRAIPVVGGILADASETVLAGAGILKGTVGVAGMLVVLAICLGPFFQLAFQNVVYKETAALCATVAQPRLGQLIESIGAAFGLVLGMTGAGALVLLVSLVSALSAVVT